MIGAFATITNLLDVNHVRESIKRDVPKAFVELNLTAFEKEYEYGKSLLRSQAY
jgi:Pyruvate/2-oxoacid:ferredoxin oxidoreductase gamma subunit